MNTEKLNSATTGFGIAAAVAFVLNTALTVAKESNPALLAAMKAAAGHHWITHGFVIVGLFLVLGWLLSRTGMRMSGGTLATTLVVTALAGGLGLVGWFYFA